MSVAAKAAIAIVAIALLAGILVFVIFIHLERRNKHQPMRPYIQRDKKNASNRTLGCEEASQVSETIGLRDGTAVVLEGGRPVVIEFDNDYKNSRRQRDPVEEERHRSEAGTASLGTGSLSSAQYMPRALRRQQPDGGGDECKNEEPEPLETQKGMSLPPSIAMPADPMTHSMASESDFSENRNGEFT